ncbi:unnamed protein product [Durusdinium trenchii]|uniref:Uncharacterized protein n=1 Tax=Durusdinium trenchii TaxID=1381693 RepID=A0ABP0LAU6_9DINO
MHFVLLFVFLKAVRGEEACDLDGGPQKQRSLLQNFAVKSAVSQENDLQPGPRLRLKVLGYNPDERPEEVQSKDTSLCEEDIFARPELCPAKCPYAAEMKKEFCHFRCVERNQCGLLGTVENATIPDDRLMVCRHCNVEGCLHCAHAKPGQVGEKLEHCRQCMPGYSLTEEGECQMKGLGFFIAMAVISVVAVILVIVWYVLISMKPCVNPEGVAEGYESRERTRLTEVSGEAYPLTTNLLSTNVAGVGTMALFRYQFALLIWAITLLLVWFGFVIFVSSDLLILGNRLAESPQMLCAIVEWGHHRQMELIWTKVSWLCFAYIFSFGGAIFYAVQQTKLFARADVEHATMASFAAKLEGLPSLGGHEPVEEKLKGAVKAATGVQPVAVSVAWDYAPSRKMVEAILEQEMEAETSAHAPHAEHETPSASGILGQAEAWATGKVLDAWHVHLEHHHVSDEEVKSLLTSMSTSSCAFVVFPSQEAQAKAIAAVKTSGVAVDQKACKLTPCRYAPEGLFWHNMGVTPEQRTRRIMLALLALAVSCTIWTFILYIPYALYMSSFSYANGDEPGEFSEGLFICLVVGSQIGLFVVSSMGAKHAAFHSEDETQKAYTMYYNAALILNLILDLALQTYLSYLQMVGVGAHTSDGRLLGSLESFQEIFESYPVQKSMGKLLFVYCWPCTFFVPFLAEPFAVQWLPQHLGQKLVGADKRIKGENAEKALELGEMEQGRYADCIFNVILVVCIPFISPAYLALTFAALIFSHLYLYLYDTVKVLRYVRKFNFSGPEVHWLGMQLFALPVAILAACLLFKANQMSGDGTLGSGFLKGYSLGLACVGVALLHFVVHLCVLEYMVKPMADQQEEQSSATYAEAAKSCPATYLSTNPIHCLRSKYILKHNPPQAFYAPGKESLAKTNPESLGWANVS